MVPWKQKKKKKILSLSQTILAAPAIFIPMTSNHLSHQSDRFHPWTLKFFTERETHCNLITASPGELSTWACGRQMKGEDCSSPCDGSSRHPGGKNELGKERRSHQSTSEEWLRGRGGHYFHQHPNLPSLVLSWHTCLPESDTYMLISGTSSNFNGKKKGQILWFIVE